MQSTAERRQKILMVLCERRRESVAALADEFGVSERTVRRDIEVLSLSSPIFTMRGRYCGGVMVMDGYYPDRRYLDPSEVEALSKAVSDIERGTISGFSKSELEALRKILRRFSKPA